MSARSALSSTSRRAFLTAVAAATAACRSTGTSQTSTPGGTGAARPIDEATIAAAERLTGVRYTAAERRLMLESIDEHLDRARLMHAHRQPHELAPAQVFSPQVPRERPNAGGDTPVFIQPVTSERPRDEDDIAFASVAQLAHWLEKNALTSMELTKISLRRLASIGRRLECVITLTEGLALEQAARADRERAAGKVRSPLHGIPWGAKDIIDTAEIRTTWGAEPFAARVPARDATVVERLHRAGAVLVAKLTSGALAYGDIWHDGRTRNPWHPAEGSSGSSAGSAAAVAAGCVAFALGTETLGSIVSPSARCGTAGLRPTFGRVPRTGCMPLCWSVDKVGVLARRAEDTLAVLQILDGPDPGDPSSQPMALHVPPSVAIEDLKIGYVPEWFEEADAVERGAFAKLQELGAQMIPLQLPKLPYDALSIIILAESANAFEDLTLDGLDDQLDWQTADAWPNTFRLSRFITAIDYISADRLRREVLTAIEPLFAGVDLMFGPSGADPMLLITNCTGHPCVTVRAGFVERAPEEWIDGLPPPDPKPRPAPVNVAFWGRHASEGMLVRAAGALEAALGAWQRRPRL